MNDRREWHILEAELVRYLTGAAQPLARASVEAHLLACDRCRADLAVVKSARPRGDERDRCVIDRPRSDDPSERTWERIADRIDVPCRPLRWSTSALRVSVASPPLFAATAILAGLMLLLVGVVAWTDPTWALPVMLVLGAVAPPIGAAVAFQTRVDPSGELAAATPLASGRLPFIRAITASVLCLPAALVAGLFTELSWRDAAVWLLPGVAMAAIVLASATRVDPIRVGVALAVAWTTVVTRWAQSHRGASVHATLDGLVANRPQSRLTYLVIAIVAVAVGLKRRDARPNWSVR